MATLKNGNVTVSFADTYQPPENQTVLYNALGRGAAQNQGGGFNPFGWVGDKINAAANTFGTVISAGADAARSGLGFIGGFENKATEDMRRQNKNNLDEVYKSIGFQGRNDFINQLSQAEGRGDQQEADRLMALEQSVTGQLQNIANANDERANTKASNYQDYRKNSYIGQKVNQDTGKYLGDAINTWSTMADIAGMASGAPFLMIKNRVAGNALQGALGGVANELSQNGFENFDWGRAGQNAVIGGISGAATAGLNQKWQPRQVTGNGGLRDLTTKAINSQIGRGAVSGALGGAIGGGLSAGFNNGDVMSGALQGAGQGAISGASSAALMQGAGKLGNAIVNRIDKTGGLANRIANNQQAYNKWLNAGNTFNERLNNTIASGDSAVGNWLTKGGADKLAERGVGLSIRNTAPVFDRKNGSVENNLAAIRDSIKNENVSYDELAYLQEHMGDIYNSGDTELMQWAGIPEFTDAESITNAYVNKELSARQAVDLYEAGIIDANALDGVYNNASATDQAEIKEALNFSTRWPDQYAMNGQELAKYTNDGLAPQPVKRFYNGKEYDTFVHPSEDGKIRVEVIEYDNQGTPRWKTAGVYNDYASLTDEWQSQPQAGATQNAQDATKIGSLDNIEKAIRMTNDEAIKARDAIALSMQMQYPGATITDEDVTREFNRRYGNWVYSDADVVKTSQKLQNYSPEQKVIWAEAYGDMASPRASVNDVDIAYAKALGITDQDIAVMPNTREDFWKATVSVLEDSPVYQTNLLKGVHQAVGINDVTGESQGTAQRKVTPYNADTVQEKRDIARTYASLSKNSEPVDIADIEAVRALGLDPQELYVDTGGSRARFWENAVGVLEADPLDTSATDNTMSPTVDALRGSAAEAEGIADQGTTQRQSATDMPRYGTKEYKQMRELEKASARAADNIAFWAQGEGGLSNNLRDCISELQNKPREQQLYTVEKLKRELPNEVARINNIAKEFGIKDATAKESAKLQFDRYIGDYGKTTQTSGEQNEAISIADFQKQGLGIRNAEQEAYKALINRYGDTGEDAIQVAIDSAEAGANPHEDKTNFAKAERYVRDGAFAIYPEDMLNDLAEIYGDSFKESTYKNKDGSWKYKNGERYIDTIYASKMAKALSKEMDARQNQAQQPTVKDWAKQGLKRINEDLSEKGPIGLTTKDVSQEDNNPETVLFRKLTNGGTNTGGTTNNGDDDYVSGYGESGLATGKTRKSNLLSRLGRSMEASQAYGTRAENRKGGIVDAGDVIDNVRKRTGISNLETQAQLADELTGTKDALLDNIQKTALGATEDGSIRGIDLTEIMPEIDKEFDKISATTLSREQKAKIRSDILEDLTNHDIDTIQKANRLRASANNYFQKYRMTPEAGDRDKGVLYSNIADLIDEQTYNAIPQDNVDAMFETATMEMKQRANVAQKNGQKQIARAYNKLADEFAGADRTIENFRHLKKDFVDTRYLQSKSSQAATAWNNNPMVTGAALGTALLSSNPVTGILKATALKAAAPAVGQAANGISAKVGGYLADAGDALSNYASTPVAPTSNNQLSLYNALGRNATENELGNNNANVAVANTGDEPVALLASNGPAYASDSTSEPTTEETTLYNSLNGGTTNTATVPTMGTYSAGTQSTGNSMADTLLGAMDRAANAGDADAFATLYQMYANAVSSTNSSKDMTNPVNWNSADRTKLINAQNGLSQIDTLANAYANATGNGGDFVSGNLRNFGNMISGGNLDPAASNYNDLAQSVGMGIIKNLVNLGVTESDAERYKQYLPALTDSAEKAQMRLETLRQIYQDQINNLYSTYNA